jgi:hypothetical protein
MGSEEKHDVEKSVRNAADEREMHVSGRKKAMTRTKGWNAQKVRRVHEQRVTTKRTAMKEKDNGRSTETNQM